MMKHSSYLFHIALLCGLLTTGPAAAANDLAPAYQSFNAGKMADAQQQVDAVLERQPGNPAARFLKGRILSKQGKATNAIKVYQKLIKDHPGMPEPYNNLAAIYASQGEYHKARDALLGAINTHPSYATAYENLGNIYSKMAIIAYNRALELDKKQKKPVKLRLAYIDRLPTAAATRVPTVVAATKPAEKPAAPVKKVRRAQPQPAPSVEHQEAQNIIETLYAWSQAWSSQKPGVYLTFYAPDFRTPGGMPRKHWERQRHQRLTKPRYIKIVIEAPEVLFVDSNHARLSFYQDYHSDRFKDKARKTLLLRKIDSQWRIIEEIIGS